MSDFLKSYIRDVPDFPKPGIIFKDITTLLKDPEALAKTGEALLEMARKHQISKVAGIESRGFIFAMYLAERLGAGFVPVRKPGKLPAETYSRQYQLEYGSDTLEVHQDAFEEGDVVLLHDDLLATGGTAEAACHLIESAGGTIVQVSFIIELGFLNGRKRLEGYDVQSVITY